MNQFSTQFRYTDRETKAKYVWLKYRSILKGHILDVGADKCYLKGYLQEGTHYVGIGLGGSPDQVVDLQKQRIPFPDNSFDCVLCLDTLEHLENIHDVFDDFCRVTRQWAIISLPNPWANFWAALRRADYGAGQHIKFYGLPVERPEDRHRWFFSSAEAEAFVRQRTARNGMAVVQIDYEGMRRKAGGWRGLIQTVARRVLLRKDIDGRVLYAGRLWAVLEKRLSR